MKRVLIISAVVLVLLLIVLAAFILLNKKEAAPPDAQGPSFPSGGTIGGIAPDEPTFVIADYDDEPIEVRDFRTTPDPYVPGQYAIVGGIDTEQSPYDIFYQETDDYFGITLYKEPLGTNRLLAQTRLQETLGITNDEMCRLNYVVAPGPGVAETYEGVNLGFSFCPGATVLP